MPDEPPTDAPVRLIPQQDWKLGQGDWFTAGMLWGAAAALFTVSIVLLAMFEPLLGPFLGDFWLVTGMFALILFATAAVFAFMRFFTASREAWFGTISRRLSRRFPCARVRVREPWMRIARWNVLTGRTGLVALAEDRAVLVVRRIPPWIVAIGLGLACMGAPRLAGEPVGTYMSLVLLYGCLALSFFTGADVHEIRYDDIEHVDAGEGHVRWTQRGPDAPRVVRLRVLDGTDPAAASPWLSPADEAAT